MGLREAAAAVRKYKNFLITTHTNAEGDAIGSQLAFYRLLKKLGKNAIMMNEDDLPCGYGFLPGVNDIRKFKANIRRLEFDCLAVLDCSDLGRTGEVYRVNRQAKPILNIDHHISNVNFGDVNWVEPHCSSTAEMVYALYKKMRVAFDRDSAICLYTGILTDTGSFRYSNTSAATHRVAAELVEFKLDIPEIYRNIHENIPYQDMTLLARILPRMKRDSQGRIIWFEVRKNMLKDKNITFDLTEHILSFARAIKGVEVVAIFKENLGVKDEIRINFRSQGCVDVNKIASYFGGGGHRAASGATVHGKISAVRKKVLSAIRKSLR